MAWLRRDPQMAAIFYDKLAAKSSREAGPDHRATLDARVQHAVALFKLGELQQAEAELAEVIIGLDPLDAQDARLLQAARNWHHDALTGLDRVPESEADARFLAESYARQLGPDHPDTLDWRQLAAVALWEAGRRDEARMEMAEVAGRRAATLGASHPDTLRAESSLTAMNGNNAKFRIVFRE